MTVADRTATSEVEIMRPAIVITAATYDGGL
jgi:hypothetical protein